MPRPYVVVDAPGGLEVLMPATAQGEEVGPEDADGCPHLRPGLGVRLPGLVKVVGVLLALAGLVPGPEKVDAASGEIVVVVLFYVGCRPDARVRRSLVTTPLEEGGVETLLVVL